MDRTTSKLVNPKYYSYHDMYNELQRTSPKELCIICLEEFTEKDSNIIKMSDCQGHYFHDICISQCRQNCQHVKCPICNKIYGVQIGNMPSGQMRIRKMRGNLPGINANFFFVINYYVEGTTINGEYYSGTERTAYMPGDAEGQELLSLLVWAFQRGITFRAGVSNTTGMRGAVWNIHHKTNIRGREFAFPDPGYLKRLRDELNERGIKF